MQLIVYMWMDSIAIQEGYIYINLQINELETSERMQEILNGAQEMIHVKVVKANRFAWVRAEKTEASRAFVWGSPH